MLSEVFRKSKHTISTRFLLSTYLLPALGTSLPRFFLESLLETVTSHWHALVAALRDTLYTMDNSSVTSCASSSWCWRPDTFHLSEQFWNLFCHYCILGKLRQLNFNFLRDLCIGKTEGTQPWYHWETLQNYSAHDAKTGTDLSFETILLSCIQDSDSPNTLQKKKKPKMDTVCSLNRARTYIVIYDREENTHRPWHIKDGMSKGEIYHSFNFEIIRI